MQLWIDPANDESQPLLLLCSQQGGGAGHHPLRDPELFCDGQISLPLWKLAGPKRTYPSGEEQARSIALAEQIKASQEAIGVMPFTYPSRTGGWMATATEHHDRLG